MIAGASWFTSCKDYDFSMHDTKYYWGLRPEIGPGHNLQQIYNPRTNGPTAEVIASADSAQVRYVIFQHTDEDLSGVKGKEIRLYMESIYNKVPQVNRQKIRGGGELQGIVITDPADSLWLANFGFKITETHNQHEH